MVGIKGFRMPKSCYDCDLCYDMIGCSIMGVNWEHGFAFSSEFENRRSVHCPLVDLGEPLVLKPTEEQKKEIIDLLEGGHENDN